MKRLPRRLFCLLACCVLLACVPARAEEVILYAYELKPPFVIDRDKQSGIYYDLASYLNERITGHTFRTVYLPRRRLEHDLELGKLHGLVIGVNPTWFKDDARTRYYWSPAILRDQDMVVSQRAKPVPYDGPESMVGRRVGLPMGYYYYGVDELVQAGRVQRDDAVNEEFCLDKLALKRVDVVIVTRRTLEFLERTRAQWKDQFYVAKKPHDEYDRMVLIPHEFASLVPDLNAALGPIMRDPAWLGIIKRY
jgi:polar amino acid transport system substrate-binding protein